MGWTAVTNSIDLLGVVLFVILFMWQLPHFLAISIFHKEDYEGAGIKVYPSTRGLDTTKRWVAFYTFLLFAFSALPVYVGHSGQMFARLVTLAGLSFILFAVSGLYIGKDVGKNKAWAKKYFWGSLIYLPLILSGIIIFR